MKKLNPDVDLYIADGCGRCAYYATAQCKVRSWQPELETLRQIVLECKLVEEVKWGVPVYTHHGKNIVNVTALKDSCTLGFYKGALLKDDHNILHQPGPNSQSARLLRFTNVDQISAQKDIIKAYITEMVAAEDAGLKVEVNKNPEPIPEELLEKFEQNPALQRAFYALTPGRQRGYIIYISQPKQSETRHSRIDKCTPKILNGEGLHDKYKSRSKK